MRELLIRLFIFLGPLGNLLTPRVFPSAFRTYYFVLLTFPFLLNRLDKKQQKLLFLFSPFFLYCLFSSLFVGNFEAPSRFCLFLFQFLFVLGSAGYLRSQNEALALYLKAFFISLVIGYMFFLGFYLEAFSFETIERFSVLAQFGYGLIRFSIGSYPNEYGIVCSFVFAILLLWLSQKEVDLPLSKTAGIFFLFITWIALLLTTTRSAYVACFLSILYNTFLKKRVFLWAISLAMLMIAFLKLFNISILKFILFGFNVLQVTEGSMGSRLVLWQQASDEFFSYPFWGKGFASFTDAHNVYLQLITELGLIGVILLISALMLTFVRRRIFFPSEKRFLNPDELFAKRVRFLGLMHVMWFAATNHNLNHHLTWIVFLFYLSHWILKGVKNSQPNNRTLA